VLRPSSTSRCTSQDAGAMFVYHGQRLMLEWQSPHALLNNASVCGLSHRGAASTRGFVWSRP
jgi:hypothetical protein